MDSDTTSKQNRDASVPMYLSMVLSTMLVILPVGIWVPLQATGNTETISSYHRWVSTLLPLDLLLFVFAVLAIPVLVRRIRSPRCQWSLTVMAAFTIWAVIALVVNPTVLGATFVARWIGAVAIVAVVGQYSWPEFRLIVATPLFVAGVMQALIGLWQHPGPGADFAYYGTQTVSHGTFVHQAGLALFLLFVITLAVAALPTERTARLIWLVGIGVMSAGIAGTLSRTGMVALVLIWATYVWSFLRDRRTYGPVLAASSLPFLFTAIFAFSGWFSRAAQLASGTAAQRSSGRTAMIREALPIIGDHPLFGVGPGGYVAELSRLHPTWEGWDLMPVHTVPLFVAAELGILAGAIIAAAMVAFGWRALRTSPAALAVFFSVAVFLLLELRTHYVPTDVVLFAVWLSTLDAVARSDSGPDNGARRLRRPIAKD